MPEICPICHKQAAPETRPFCSARCADVDLGRWLTGQYAVPGADGDAGDDGGSAGDAQRDGEGKPLIS